jgi:ferrochelatase
MTALNPLGVLFMAYGGPNSLDELPGYLTDIRRGRPTTPAVLEEITRNYRQIGGRSPLLEFTKQQVEAVVAATSTLKTSRAITLRRAISRPWPTGFARV